jgi:3-methyl-2-oxobutanoate hydroxymethyltransferase
MAKKVTLKTVWDMKARGEAVVALGVYDAPLAAIADEIGFHLFVIGNSGPMCLFGHRSSPDVPGDELLFMTQAVSRVTRGALVVATMPYGSYLTSKGDAVRAALRLMSEGGADAVQCHGDRHCAKKLRAIVRAGVPVLAHIGLQSVRKSAQSGFRVQGRSEEDAMRLIEDADALAEAGVFAFIAELIPSELAEFLAERLPVPVISLGSGPRADGVYLVGGDLIGLSAFPRPSNAGRFADVGAAMSQGLRAFFDAVRAGAPCERAEPQRMAAAELAQLREYVARAV